MRLGSYECEITPDSKAFEVYKETLITERHRHRYEFNGKYENMLFGK
jgi:CTP synthase